MLKSIKIGNIIINEPVFLAPMCGISDAPYREIVAQFGDNLKFSEMIASRAAVEDLKQLKKKAYKKDKNEVLAVQLAGCDPKVLAEAAKINQDMGADIIDLNFGCPVKKVVNSLSGSALMKDEDLAARLIEATVNAVQIPVTVKTRMGWSEEILNAPSLAKKAENVGAQMITIHGRTRSQMFTGEANWEFVKNVKDAVKIPVIVNGDIKNTQNAIEALQLSGADGVMIGRGSYGKPWIIRQITDELAGKKFEALNQEQIAKIVNEHFDRIIDFYGAIQGLCFAKKHLGYYSKGLIGGAEFRMAVNTSNDVDFIKEQILMMF